MANLLRLGSDVPHHALQDGAIFTDPSPRPSPSALARSRLGWDRRALDDDEKACGSPRRLAFRW
jgi:hypothetical protein